MDPHFSPAIRDPLALAMALKVDLIARFGLSREADISVCGQLFRDGQPFAFVAPDTEHHELGAYLLSATIALAGADAVTLMADTYAYVWRPGDEPLSEDTPALSRLFAQGDGRVREAIMAALWTKAGYVMGGLISYRVVGRKLEWLDAPHAGAMSGDLISGGLLSRSVMLGLNPPTEQEPARDWRDLAAMVTVDEMKVWAPIDLPAPRRNDPCPCGSGRKAKHCCYGNERKATK